MWWTLKNGVKSGPFTRDKIETRLRLGMLGPLDRISEDGGAWQYVRETEFWKQERTIPEPVAMPVSSATPKAKISLAERRMNRAQARQPTHTLSPVPVDSELQPPIEAPSPVVEKPHRMNRPIVITISVLGTLVAVFVVLFAISAFSKKEENSRPISKSRGSASFRAVQDKLAIIVCGGAKGSGFLAKMDGKVYLVSNEHVFRGGEKPTATLLDGTILNLGAFSVAEDRDLARFEVPGASSGLRISHEAPTTADFCAIYGNSGGSGVATDLKGTLTGVGPKLLETDIDFIAGNSGSPALNAKGDVIGAADLSENSKATEREWGKKDTRFDSIRRFLVRIDENVKWMQLDRDEYERQVACFELFRLFQGYLVLYIIVDESEDDTVMPRFNELDAQQFGADDFGFAECLSNVRKAYDRRELICGDYFALLEEGEKRIARANAEGMADDEVLRMASDFARANEMEEKWEKAKDSEKAFSHQLKRAVLHGCEFIKRNRWDAPQLVLGHTVDSEFPLEGVDFWLNWLTTKLESLEQRERDLEKIIKRFEGDYSDEE